MVIIDYFGTGSRTQKERASKICKSCNDVSVQVLNKDDRLDVLINKIKSVYAKDMNTLVFMVYDKFENSRISADYWLH